MAAAAPVLGNEPIVLEDSDFQTVTYSRGELKHRIKRKREGSLAIENLLLMTESSASDSDPNIFCTPTQNSRQTTELKVYITPIEKSKSLKNVNPITIAKNIRDVCPNPVEFIKPTTQGLLIKCKNQKQVKALSQLSNIGTIPVKVTEKQIIVKGVISGVTPEMSEEDMYSELKHQGVTNVKRMSRRSKNANPNDSSVQEKFFPLRTVVLTFNKSNLPSSVTMCYQMFKVNQYIPPVLRCFKCQRYGHGISQCTTRLRCVRCGENHSFEECPRKETPKCINCGGDHSAAYNGCSEAKRAKKVQVLKITNKISYAQATRMYSNQTKPVPDSIETHPPVQPTDMNNDTNTDSFPLPPRPVRSSASVRPKEPTTHNMKAPQPLKDPNQRTEKSKPVGKEKNSETDKYPLRENIITSATDEQLISFITQLVLTFTKEKSEVEILSLVQVAAKRLLQQREQNNPSDVYK